MTGGMGAMLAPSISWQGLFLAVGAAGITLLSILSTNRHIIAAAVQPMPGSLGDLASGYEELFQSFRGVRTYVYVLLNSIFHSGVFTWLGLYLEREHRLGPAAIGLALLS
jgi:predicted MFS family arabinose efflux permease